MILLNGTAWNNADGMIKVDIGKPALPTAQEMARALAGNDGIVVTIDGHDAIRVATASSDMSKPQHAIVIYRNDKVYLLMATGVRGTDVTEALDHVIQSWHWSSAP
jgi:hypothetical protein